MRLLDLRKLGEQSSIEADLCVVGSGPAGATIANEFAGSSVRVLIVEGGGTELTPEIQALYDFENVGVARYPGRNRILGGTSHTWAGRCVAFDDIDFERRPWVQNSGWPISQTNVLPFLDRAGEYLEIGPNVYGDQLWKKLGIAPPQPSIDPNLVKCQFWQLSRDKRGQPTRFSRIIAAIDAPNIDILTHANVRHVNTSPCGTRIDSLEVYTLEGKRIQVKSKIVVLACGGIENARLLLASNKIVQNGVGNGYDLVGRFLMDHPRCTLGWFQPNSADIIQNRFGRYWLNERGWHHYVHGFGLSSEVQRTEQLLNCAAFVLPVPSSEDPWRALKSLLAKLKLNVIVSEQECSATLNKELNTVIRHFPGLLNNAYWYVVKRRGPIVKAQEIMLRCLVEQVPDPARRVTLSNHRDALGMPLSRIDWRIDELERRSVLRLSELIGRELKRIGLPEHSANIGLSNNLDWRSSFDDSCHPTGTTRMANSPQHGVVDRNCRVHGVAGLYIAGSSVFPTAGHGNPTLMIVALAIRLADWLMQNEFRSLISATSTRGERKKTKGQDLGVGERSELENPVCLINTTSKTFIHLNLKSCHLITCESRWKVTSDCKSVSIF